MGLGKVRTFRGGKKVELISRVLKCLRQNSVDLVDISAPGVQSVALKKICKRDGEIREDLSLVHFIFINPVTVLFPQKATFERPVHIKPATREVKNMAAVCYFPIFLRTRR